MSKKIFNPNDWNTPKENLSPNTLNSLNTSKSLSSKSPSLGGVEEVEEITRRIESTATDIAPNYADWRDLGFALADALGESGRNYFHRLSRFYSKYNQAETDKQFSACLKSHGHGVTIKTLFHLAKQAGVSVSVQIAKSPNCQNGKMEKWQNTTTIETPKPQPNETINLPTFPDDIYSSLPEYLQQITVHGISPEDKDFCYSVLSWFFPRVFQM